MLDISRGREFELVTGIVQARRHCVNKWLDIPFLNGPVGQGNRWRNSVRPVEPALYPLLIRHKPNFVRAVSNCDKLDMERLPIEREWLQAQRLCEGSDITLTIIHCPIGIDFDTVWELAAYRTCFVHNTQTRVPNLFEGIANNPVASVSQTRIFPAQHHGDLGGEVLERAVDVTNVHDPDSDRDLSWSRLLRRPLNQSRRFRALRGVNRHRKEEQKQKMDCLHEIVTGNRPDRDSPQHFSIALAVMVLPAGLDLSGGIGTEQ